MAHVQIPHSYIEAARYERREAMFSDLSQSPLSKNLQRLFLLRNIVIAAQCPDLCPGLLGAGNAASLDGNGIGNGSAGGS